MVTKQRGDQRECVQDKKEILIADIIHLNERKRIQVQHESFRKTNRTNRFSIDK